MNERRHESASWYSSLATSLAIVATATLGDGSRAQGATAVPGDSYHFERTISREALDGYLSRAITMEGTLNGRGDFADNLRMIQRIGAKFIGRSICLWGHEAQLLANLKRAAPLVERMHAADPDLILQACVFEIVTDEVEQVPVPPWAFTALGLPVETRNFRYQDIIYPPGQRRDWGPRASVPDVTRPETRLWFYFLARSYIDLGFEAIHFGQVEIMANNDPQLDHWAELLTLVRTHAAQHARRRIVLCDGHVPSGGLVRDGRLLLDFHSFPLRVKEVPERPREGVLEVGHVDSIFRRSKGGVTPSGWTCDALPYLVEIDNWGVSDRPGESGVGGVWVWGCDEITWFAHQPQAYRAQWLRYAWNWLRVQDPVGHLQMPGSRTIYPLETDLSWYHANDPSDAVPLGRGDEGAIRDIWLAAEKGRLTTEGFHRLNRENDAK